MGYYSSVMIRCREGAFDMLKQPCIGTRANYIAKCKDYDEYLICFEWTKWYDSYDDVSEIISTLKKT